MLKGKLHDFTCKLKSYSFRISKHPDMYTKTTIRKLRIQSINHASFAIRHWISPRGWCIVPISWLDHISATNRWRRNKSEDIQGYRRDQLKGIQKMCPICNKERKIMAVHSRSIFTQGVQDNRVNDIVWSFVFVQEDPRLLVFLLPHTRSIKA